MATSSDGLIPEIARAQPPRLTYSQSANPRSPFFADQGPLFSRKQWVPVRFCRGDVLRHTLSTTVLRAPR
jgi:acyl-homoserine lactone acylase PvdQ